MIQDIEITELIEGYNPRKNVGDLDSLKHSIEEMGLLNPLLVRQVDGKYEIIAGHRRFLAAKEIGKKTLSCMVRDISDVEAFHLAFIDNKERNNLNALEEAEHYKECQGKGMTVRDIGSKYNLSHVMIVKQTSLLELPLPIQDILGNSSYQFSPTHAYEISKLCKPADLQKLFEDNKDCFEDWQQACNDELTYRQEQQIKLANAVIDSDMSVKRLSDKVKDLKSELNERDDNITELIEKEKEKQSTLDGIYFKDASDMSEFEDESVHLIVTSPPYMAGKEYETNMTFDEYETLIIGVLKECVRVLKPSCKLIINIGDITNMHKVIGVYPDGTDIISDQSQRYSICRMFEPECDFLGLKLKDTIIWKKDDPWQSNPHIKYQDQESKYRILPSTEYIYIYEKPGEKRAVPESLKLESSISKDEWKQYVSGLWDIPSVRNNNNHPSKFPDELPRRLIKMYSFVGDKILDPFLGSGTTVKVARELNRSGFGYELHEDLYKEVIRSTLESIKIEDSI